MRKGDNEPCPTGDFPRVQIRWMDACNEAGWRQFNRSKYEPPRAYVTTMGFVVHEDEDRVTVAQSIADCGEGDVSVGEVLSIPLVCIVDRKVI